MAGALVEVHMTLRQSTYLVLVCGLICIGIIALGGGKAPRSEQTEPSVKLEPVSNLGEALPGAIPIPLRFM